MTQDFPLYPPTNAETADAATTPTTGLGQALTLIGVFGGGADGDSILVRDADGTIARIATGFLHPASGGPLRLIETGDGWAMVQQAGRIHRLVIG